jgi:glycosyltransferase involved in cell wall biosynthesis
MINQYHWIPGILSSMGHEAEIWAVDHKSSVHQSKLKDFGDYIIRFFEPTQEHKKTKIDYSDEMVEYAQKNPADLYLLKGVDGGIGLRMIKQLLLPENLPYVMQIGGEYYNSLNKHAEFILYESEYQKNKLMNPGIFFWRHSEPEYKLIQLQKSIDTDLFKPYPSISKEFDTISVGRIVKHNKRFDEIGELSHHFKVAILGDGPYKNTLEKKYPKIHWLDRVQNADVPKVLNRAKLYIHPSAKDWILSRDFYPRAIAEALSCGLPCVGFDDAIQEDIIPKNCGIIIKRKEVVEKVRALLADEERISKMSKNARERATRYMDKYSSKIALEKLFNRLEIV